VGQLQQGNREIRKKREGEGGKGPILIPKGEGKGPPGLRFPNLGGEEEAKKKRMGMAALNASCADFGRRRENYLRCHSTSVPLGNGGGARILKKKKKRRKSMNNVIVH